MKLAIIEAVRGCNACPICDTLGVLGATCHACLRRAYRNALAMTNTAKQFSAKLAASVAVRERRGALLAGLAGAELICEALPTARFEAPST